MFTDPSQTQGYVGTVLENKEVTHGVTELLVSPVYLEISVSNICCEGRILIIP